MTQTSLLTLPSELKSGSHVSGMLYGQPGVGKTTVALSAPSPILIDLDRGMKRVKAVHRVPSLQVDSYEQVLDLLKSNELKPFETIVIDTAGKLIDRIQEYVIRQDSKMGTRSGTLTMQGWGEVKKVFGSLMKLLNAQGKSIIFVAHESEEKVGEDTIKRPDISGGARKDVVKELDFMGYMEKSGEETVIRFNPTDKFYAKNSLDLDGSVPVPFSDETRPNNFLSKYLFKASDERLAAQAELRSKYEAIITGINKELAALKTVEDVNKFYAKIPEAEALWDSPYYTKAELLKRTKELGVEFNKATKQFEAKGAPEAKKDEKKGDAAAKPKGRPRGQKNDVAPAETPAPTPAPAPTDAKGDGFSSL